MHTVSNINFRPCGLHEKYWILSQVIWNLFVFKYDHINWGSSYQYFCIFSSIKTARVVGEGTRCCLIAVDHHKRCQIDK